MIKKPQFYFFTFILLFLPVFISSCKSDPRKDIDLEKVEVPGIKLLRFEQDVFSMDTSDIKKSIAALKARYPVYFDFFAFDIMQWDSADLEKNLLILRSDPANRDLMDTVNKIYGDFSEQKTILDEAFKRYSYHLPTRPVPEIITTITEFSFPTATDDSLLVISLEMFLGADYKYYPSFGLPVYKIRRMNKQHLPYFAMVAWYDQLYGDLPKGGRFIDEVIANGKQMYFLETMLPNVPDSLRTGWTTSELTWLKENESQMWTFYIESKYLYSTDRIEYSSLLNDAPFSSAPGVPPESAPRIGVYTGLQIIKKYMDAHPEITLEELFLNTNTDQILKDSGYRP